MKNIGATFVAIALVLGTALQAQPSSSQPTAEQRLERMGGRWRIEERYAGDPAKYVKTSSCELFAGGPHLVCTSDAETPLGPSKGISILSYNRVDGTFFNYHVAGVGVAVLIHGKVSDGAWIGDTEFPFDGRVVKARVTVTDGSPDVWTYKMEGSIGGSASFVLQEARATRVE